MCVVRCVLFFVFCSSCVVGWLLFDVVWYVLLVVCCSLVVVNCALRVV